MRVLIKEKLSPNKYKTPEGYLVCVDAILARTGKQQYRKNELYVDSDDDSIVDVDRPYDEVFSEQTIASFENKPFVNEHPNEDVNVHNHKDYAVGFVRDVHKGEVDGEPVLLGNLIITDEETIAEIESGEKTELSCGYDCDITDDENPCQRNIRGNHVALCKAGRAGIARIQDSKVEDSKWYVVYGEESGYMKEFKTLSEAKKFIKETQSFDKREGIEDEYYIEVEVHDSVKDAGTTRRLFRESEVGDENSWFGTTEWGTPKGSMYIYKKNGKIIAEGSSSGWSGNALEKGEKKEFNSVKDLNKWLNTPVEDSIKDVRNLTISGWEYNDNDFSKELNELKQSLNSNKINDSENKLNKLLGVARDCLYQIDNATSRLNGERKDYYENIISQLMDLRKQHNLKDGECDMKDSFTNYKGYKIEKLQKLSDKTYVYQFGTSDGDICTFKSLEEAKKYIDKNLTKDSVEDANMEDEYVGLSVSQWERVYWISKKINRPMNQLINEIEKNVDSGKYKNEEEYIKKLEKDYKMNDSEELVKDAKKYVVYINGHKQYDKFKTKEEAEKWVEKEKRHDEFEFKHDKYNKVNIKYEIKLEDSEELVEDGKLIEPEQKYVKEFERMIQRAGFKIDRTGKTISGRLHYQVISNQKGYDEKDLKQFSRELEKIANTMRSFEIPMTYNVGLQVDTYISAGIDLDKQYVKDSVEDIHFTVSSNRNSEEFNSEEELLKKYKVEGYDTVRGIKAPKLKGLYGPFFNGNGKILYETKERYMGYDSKELVEDTIKDSKQNPLKYINIVKKVKEVKDSKIKDEYYIVACESGPGKDEWFNEQGKPDVFKKAKKFKTYQEADNWRRKKGEGSVQKINDSKVKDMTKNELKLAVKQIIKKNINKIITYQDFELSNNYNLWSRDEDDKEYRLYYQSKKTNDIGEFVCINITIKKDKKHTIEVEIF